MGADISSEQNMRKENNQIIVNKNFLKSVSENINSQISNTVLKDAKACSADINNNQSITINKINTKGDFVFNSTQKQTAALTFGGYTTTQVGTTESWNGSAWTAVNSMVTARNLMSSFGTQTAAIGAAGRTSTSLANATTETWNGTSWSNLPNMGTARYNLAGSGTQTAGLAFAGNPGPAVTNVTEEWTGETSTANSKTLTTS